MLYPLRFAPVYFEKVWGNRRLETVMGRPLPPGQPIGESWEVSDHPHGKSIITNGPLRGTSLHDLIEREPVAVLGSHVRTLRGDAFPLLVKYIDADDQLSVQVHPDDEYAQEHEGELGKTEMWYVLHADPDAEIIAGLREGVSKEEFIEALQDGDPAMLLYHLPIKSGETILIPAGRIHALLPGLLVLEIQENSDTTYRLYDWGRVGLDGKPRELHIDKALAVSNWADYQARPATEHPELLGDNRKSVLTVCEYFTVEKYSLASEQIFKLRGDRFYILNCVAGAGALTWYGGVEMLHFGDSVLLPADLTDFAVQPEGEASFLLSYVT
ncbi:MAG: type I phosphomannose isomerase catalytic subunit [Armatimonadota bacterium]